MVSSGIGFIFIFYCYNFFLGGGDAESFLSVSNKITSSTLQDFLTAGNMRFIKSCNSEKATRVPMTKFFKLIMWKNYQRYFFTIMIGTFQLSKDFNFVIDYTYF